MTIVQLRGVQRSHIGRVPYRLDVRDVAFDNLPTVIDARLPSLMSARKEMRVRGRNAKRRPRTQGLERQN